MQADPESIVRDFCKAWELLDAPCVFGMLADDIVYQNVPRPAYIGKAAVVAFLEPIFRRALKIEFRLLAIAVAADGRRVLTERLDRLHFSEGVIDIPLMGIMELDDQGLIAAWRDYPDSGHVAAQWDQLTARHQQS